MKPLKKFHKISVINLGKLLVVLGFICAVFVFPRPTQAAGASMGIYPSSGSYGVGSQISVSLMISSSTTAINAAEGTIKFDPSMLEAVSVSKNSSIFTLWTTEPTLDNSSGTVSFGGGSQQGFLGNSGRVLGINFRTKREGVATLSVISSAVLAADGVGTNILNAASGGSYTVKSAVQTPAPETNVASPEKPIQTKEVVAGNKPEAIKVNSSSHPDPDKWYSSGNLEVSWSVPQGATSLAMGADRDPDTSPEKIYSASTTSKTIEDLSDGVWYFHLQAKNSAGWGSVSHRKVMIDTQAPEKVVVSSDNQGDPANPSPTLNIHGEDSGSGVDRFEVSLGGGKFESVGTNDNGDANYTLEATEPGDHLVFVRAVDKANNYRIIESSITIEPLATPIMSGIKATSFKNEPLLIQGSTNYPGATIILTFTKNDGSIMIAEQRADNRGTWSFVHKDNLCLGTYTVSARVVDSRGAESIESQLVAFEVVEPDITGWLKSASFILALVCFLIGVFLCLAIVLAVLFHRQIRSKTLGVGANMRKHFKKFFRG